MSAEKSEAEATTASPTKDFNLLEATYPVGAALSAQYKLGFGYKTINQRIPVIVTKIIDQLARDKDELAKEYGEEAKEEIKIIIGALAKLKNEMITNKPIIPVGKPAWDNYLKLMADRYFHKNVQEVTWYLSTWLHVECYFYRRIDDAFKLTNLLKNYDPFLKQKKDGFLGSLDAAVLLGEYTNNSDSSDSVLRTLLQVGLWGNRCDLSLSLSEEASQLGNLVEQLQDLRKYILCDDSENFWKILKESKNSNSKTPVSIGYVLDNSGFELFTDFCLADKLMDHVDHIDFYVKTTPWFVSDALSVDFHWLLEKMSTCAEHPVLTTLGQKWKGFVETKRWNVVEADFWTYPHAFSEMKDADPELYSRLSTHTHLIFKGDLNYRKLIGDVNWSPETPFNVALRGFCPAPLLSLRTLKADCIAGLKKGIAEETQEKNSDWMTTGVYGVLQHAQPGSES